MPSLASEAPASRAILRPLRSPAAGIAFTRSTSHRRMATRGGESGCRPMPPPPVAAACDSMAMQGNRGREANRRESGLRAAARLPEEAVAAPSAAATHERPLPSCRWPRPARSDTRQRDDPAALPTVRPPRTPAAAGIRRRTGRPAAAPRAGLVPPTRTTTMKQLTLLQLNDLHGYLEPHPELVRAARRHELRTLGGLARIAGLFDAVRARDRRRGRRARQRRHLPRHLRRGAVDAARRMVPLDERARPRRHDGRTGSSPTARQGFKRARRRSSTIRCSPSTAIDKAGGELVFAPYRVVERGGLRIGVIGLACPIVDKTMPPASARACASRSAATSCRAGSSVCARAEGVDLVVVLSHLGFPQDVQLAARGGGHRRAGERPHAQPHARADRRERRDHLPVGLPRLLRRAARPRGSTTARVVGHRHRADRRSTTRFPEEPAMARAGRARPSRRTGRCSARSSAQAPATLDRYAMLQPSMDDVLLDAIAAAAGHRDRLLERLALRRADRARPGHARTTSGTSSRPIRRSRPSS